MKPNITGAARPPAAVQSPQSRATMVAPAQPAAVSAPAPASAPASGSVRTAGSGSGAVPAGGRVKATLGPSFNKRNQQTIVRLTAQEKTAIQELAHQEGLTMSELVRRKVLGDKVSF